MSRLLSVAAAALVFGTVVASAADATDRLILRVNGHITGVGAVIDQSLMGELDDAAFAVDTGLFGSAILPLDGGGEIGARVALDVDYASNFDSFLNDAGASNVLEEAWLYWDGRYGRLQVGLMDGAADVIGVTVPSVSSGIRMDNPEIYLVGFPCETTLFSTCSSDPGLPGSLFNPNGMQLRSDIHGSDDFLKIMYATPVMDGFRFAVSYAPTATRDPGQIFDNDQRNGQNSIWDFAASYVGTLGEVDLGASVGYVIGDVVNDRFYPELDGVEEWGAALKLGYREWTLGAAYRNTNVAGGGPLVQGFVSNVFEEPNTEIWSFGLMYERGPWAASVNYVTAMEELTFGSEQEGDGVQFALGYTISESFRVTGGYQHYEFEGPANFCDTGFCDTLDANVGYLETTFSF
jgi:hypothetical protein